MNDIERAERKSRQRAIIFYLLTGVLIVNAVIGFLPLPADPDPASPRIVLGFWLVMVMLVVLNLLPTSRWRSGRIAALLDDESTREHRRDGFTAGFWAAIICAGMLAILTSFHPLPATDVAKIVITAALAAALTCFATLELRAAR